MSDGAGGGTWSSSNTTVATIGPAGNITGVSAGTATVSYTTTGCNPATIVATVYPLPAPISGASICAGAAITLSDAVTGGTWSSSNTGVATADTASGVITGGGIAAAGTATITYTAPGGGATTAVITVNPLPAAISSTAGNICAGAVTSLSDAVSGGVWSTGNTAVATVGSTGTVTGVSGRQCNDLLCYRRRLHSRYYNSNCISAAISHQRRQHLRRGSNNAH